MRYAELFLERVRRLPHEDGPRLVYADYLDRRGDPRGEFIRVQVALAKLPADDPRRPELAQREYRLLKAHGPEWGGPLRGLAAGLEFRRGFVEVINVEARRFLAGADGLFALTPLRHVRLLDVGSSLRRLASFEPLSRLAGLTLYAQHLGEGLAAAVAGCAHLAGLRVLEVGRNRLGDAGCEMLAASPHLARLEHLDLSDNQVGDVGARALAGWAAAPRLTRLELSRNELTRAGLASLARSPRLRLSRLGVSHNRLSAAGGSPGGSPAPARLRRLDLRGNALRGGDLDALLSLPELAELSDLDLGHNLLGDGGAGLLAASPAAAGLERLFLNGNQLGDRAVAALADSEWFRRLHTLDVQQNPHIFDASGRLLMDAVRFPSLRRLALPASGLSPRLRRMLMARFGPPVRD